MLKRLLAGVLAAFALAAPVHAADSNMFRGKTMTYIVATGPGGIYDTHARILTRFLAHYLPGARILVKNVPGAGHIVGASTLYAAKPDGLTIGTFNTGLIYDQLLKRPGAQFDLTRMTWLGKATNDTRALILATNSAFRNFDDLLKAKAPAKFAAAGIGSASYIETRILQDALHVPLQLISGFDGSEAEMAMMRQEIVAQIGTATSLESFVKSGKGSIALIISDSAAYPGIPRAADYAKDERARQLLALVSTVSQIGRLTAGPPDMPPATREVLRDAVLKAMHDPGYIAETRRLGLPLDPASGARVEAMVKAALMQSPETIAYLTRAASK
jgi:tripartite-type tricarboxylate transporter receptor subunit TctC